VEADFSALKAFLDSKPILESQPGQKSLF